MCTGRTLLELSLELHQEWTSVWDATCKDFAHTFGAFAEITPRVDLSMGCNMLGFPKENERFQVCTGRTLLEHSLKLHQEWASVWDAKCQDFQRKTNDFRCVRGALSLELHQEWTSVWDATCNDFQRKMNDFRCVRGAHFWSIR